MSLKINDPQPQLASVNQRLVLPMPAVFDAYYSHPINVQKMMDLDIALEIALDVINQSGIVQNDGIYRWSILDTYIYDRIQLNFFEYSDELTINPYPFYLMLKDVIIEMVYILKAAGTGSFFHRTYATIDQHLSNVVVIDFIPEK